MFPNSVCTNTGSRDQTTICGFDEEEHIPCVDIKNGDFIHFSFAVNSFMFVLMVFLTVFLTLTEDKKFNTELLFVEKKLGASECVRNP
jgi:hypothetical protein